MRYGWIAAPIPLSSCPRSCNARRPGPPPPMPPTRRATARRRKLIFAALALLVAVALHALVIVLLAWALPHWPRPPMRKGATPIQLMIQPAEPAASPGLHPTETVPSSQPEYIRTTDEMKKGHSSSRSELHLRQRHRSSR